MTLQSPHPARHPSQGPATDASEDPARHPGALDEQSGSAGTAGGGTRPGSSVGSSAGARLFLASRAGALSGGAMLLALAPLLVVLLYDGNAAYVAGVLLVRQVVSVLLRYPAAVWLDARGDSLDLQVRAQAVVAAAIVAVPALWWAGLLRYPLLLALLGVIFTAEVFIATAGYGTLNRLVGPGERVAYVGQLNAVTSVADVVGQSTGPALLRFVPAPVALLAAAGAHVLAAAVLLLVRASAPPCSPRVDHAGEPAEGAALGGVGVAPTRRRRRARELAAGFARALGFVARRHDVVLLWALAGSSALAAPAVVLYALEELGVSVELVGLLTACGAVGGVAGGMTVARVQRVAPARLVGLCALISAAAVPLLVLGELVPALTYPGVAGFEALSAFAGTIAVSIAFGRLQEDTPSPRLAQTMAAARVGADVVLVAALAAGGAAGAVWSPQAAVLLAGAALVLTATAALLPGRRVQA